MSLNPHDDPKAYLRLLPDGHAARPGRPASSYDADGDVLYLHFGEPSRATDSELTEDDLIIRYDGEEVIGLTILHASRR